MTWLRTTIRILSEISSEIGGVFSRDVERCTEVARAARGLDPSWCVTEAADLGNVVWIRFEREQFTKAWQVLVVQVDKGTCAVAPATAQDSVPPPDAHLAVNAQTC